MGEDSKPVINKTIVLLGAFAVIILLVVTTPGWKDIFGLSGINFSSQFLVYALIAAGIVGLVVFAMSASKEDKK
ncbi:MAG: hypothetical protein V1820_00980 [archaeon]